MSRKNVVLPYQLFTDADVSLDQLSDAVNVQYLDNAGIQVKFTGTPTGVFEVLASINGVDYESLVFASTITTAQDSFLINMQQLPYVWFKLSYIASSGSGTLNAWTSVKAV